MISITIFSALIYTIISYFYHGKLVFFTKLIASLSFFINALVNYLLSDNIINILLLFALFFAFLGDIILGLKKLLKKEKLLKNGILVFLIAHLFFFLFSLAKTPTDIPVRIILSLIISFVLSLFLEKIGKFLSFDYADYKKYAIIYIACLAFVVAFTFTKAFSNNFNMYYLIGIALFIISDFVLSLVYFGKSKYSNLFSLINHLFYYSATILISLSIM